MAGVAAGGDAAGIIHCRDKCAGAAANPTELCVQVPWLASLPVATWLGWPAATAWGWKVNTSLGYVGQARTPTSAYRL